MYLQHVRAQSSQPCPTPHCALFLQNQQKPPGFYPTSCHSWWRVLIDVVLVSGCSVVTLAHHRAPPHMDQGSFSPPNPTPSQGATFHQLESCVVPTEWEDTTGSVFILTAALFSILTVALFFPLGSPFPSLPVSSPHACSKPSLLTCLPVFFFFFFFNERAIQIEPRECQAKFLKQAFSSGRRPKHIHSLIGPLADTQLTPPPPVF